VGKPRHLGPAPSRWWAATHGGQQHQNPQIGQTNYIYVRVRNIGAVDVTNILVHVHGAKAAASFSWPQDWMPEIGTASIASLPAGQTAIVQVPWQPPFAGHYCFLSRIEAIQDPITHDGWVKFDNNVSQKNVHVFDLMQAPLDSPIILTNPQQQPTHIDLLVASTGFPAGGTATLEFADPGLFQRWQDAGGDLQGAEVVPGTTSLSILPSPELGAVIGRVPMAVGEESQVFLRVTGPAGSQPIVTVTERVGGELVGGNIFQPPVLGIPGDGDGDGFCTELDAMLALQMATGALSEDLTLDVNTDGRVDESDALLLMTWAARDGQCG